MIYFAGPNFPEKICHAKNKGVFPIELFQPERCATLDLKLFQLMPPNVCLKGRMYGHMEQLEVLLYNVVQTDGVVPF